MRADALSYKKASSVATLGLVTQVIFCAATVVYGVLDGSSGAKSAAIFMGAGVLAWLTLIIVFDQHRRERLEALEQESLDAMGTPGGSVFERRGEEFRVAAQRLRTLYRFFVPGVSLVIGGGLVAWSIVRLVGETGAINAIRSGLHAPSRHGPWAIGLGTAIAFLGFILARYASGMAKQAAWAGLRAGAAFTVGSAILGLALAACHFIDMVGPDTPLRYLVLAVPVFTLLIGAEVLLNQVLDIYRPRKAGEVPRPAFDSRLLGFAAAPDRIAQSINEAINYQLGFNVTGGWLFQLLSRAVAPLLVVGLAVMWGLTSLAVLEPHQRGTILRFGKPVRENIGPGLHVKLPWPIDTVYVPEDIARDAKGRKYVRDVTATGVRTINLATAPPGTTEPLLWTNDHLGEEVFQLVRGGAFQDRGRGPGGLDDLALVSIEVPLRYAVSDVARYDRLAPPGQRDDILKAVAQREILLFLQGVTLDDVLGPRRVALSAELRTRVERAFAALNPSGDGGPGGAGVEVLSCAIVGVHPPKQNDVAASFEKVIEADQRYLARLDGARADEIKSLAETAGSVEGARALADAIAAHGAASRESKDGRAPAALEAEVEAMLARSSGVVAGVLSTAKGERWRQHMGAKTLSTTYLGQLAAYEASPVIYRAGAYFKVLRTCFEDVRVYITSDQLPDLRVDAQLEDKDSGIAVFKAQKND